MKPEQEKQLRTPFPASAIGRLPRKTKDGRMIYLDYVGHAAVTDRLLDVDPEWGWEPVASSEVGLPIFDRYGGLWIRLTVAGVTRYGYGDCGGKQTPEGVKEAIGDAIRNAAMRFGVALDLWAKGELPSASEGSEAAGVERRPAASGDVVTAQRDEGPSSNGDEPGEGESEAHGEGVIGSPAPGTAPTFDDLAQRVGSRAKARTLLNSTVGASYTAASVLDATPAELEAALAVLEGVGA